MSLNEIFNVVLWSIVASSFTVVAMVIVALAIDTLREIFRKRKEM